MDLSAAFDTVSHPLLLNRLIHHFGIQGTVLRWFENYKTDRSQKIALDDSNNKAVVSDHAILKQEVPHGRMRTNLLKLNDDKTELIVLGTRQQLSKVGDVSIMIGSDTISAVPSV